MWGEGELGSSTIMVNDAGLLRGFHDYVLRARNAVVETPSGCVA